jgi:hypothetical protein
VHDENLFAQLQSVAHDERKNSHPLDLSDGSLFANLKKRSEGGEKSLALNLKKKDKHSVDD